ncbi:hypothetical protein J6TS2_03560 [Heyndrickxia sporothermodurans]|nr:hypothetical protein J6TS2_03560 [Heyndrickxia sporothermodurans]
MLKPQAVVSYSYRDPKLKNVIILASTNVPTDFGLHKLLIKESYFKKEGSTN